MTQRKTDKMLVRMTPETHDALRRLAEQDCRSMAGELEWLIRGEAERRGAGGNVQEAHRDCRTRSAPVPTP